MYKLVYMAGWDKNFEKMDKHTQKQIWKKIQKQANETKTRHLKYGLSFFVAESGQNRIVLKIKDNEQTKEIWFAGSHKQYDEWRKALK